MKSNNSKKFAFTGLSVFIVFLFIFVTLGAYLQYHYKILGLFLTELILLLAGILPMIFLKIPPKDMLKIKKPKFKKLIGCVIIWIGAFILSTFSVLLISYFAPELVNTVSLGINELLESVSIFERIFVIAITPAICEEIFHRGFIQYTFKEFSNISKVIFMGIIFGIFHLDPTRFFATGILGAVLTYSYIATGNFLAPVFIHFLNNFVSLVPTFFNNPDLDSMSIVISSSETLKSIGAHLYLVAFVPFIFILSSRLLKDDIDYNKYRKMYLYLLPLVLVLFILAAFISVSASAELSVLGLSHK